MAGGPSTTRVVLCSSSLQEDSPPKRQVDKEDGDRESKSPHDKGKIDKKAAKNEKEDSVSTKERVDKAASDSKQEDPAKDGSKPKGKGKKGDKKVNKGKKGRKEEEPKKEPEVEEPPYEPVKEVEPGPESPREGIVGRSRGMSNQQFWRLLQDAHILQPGMGVADVDRMLPLNEFSWDPVSDVHSPTRQLILREVIVALVLIALCKFQKEQISSEEKVEKLFVSAFRSLATLNYGSWYFKGESARVRAVLSENKALLRRLFCELLLESETRDYTISLGSLIKYGQGRRPQHDVPPGALIARVLQELYYYNLKPADNVFDCLYHNINYKEFEIILLIFSTLGEDLKPEGDKGAMEQLADLLKGFLGGSAGKGLKGSAGSEKKIRGKLEPKKEKKRKDNPPWVK